MSGNRCRGLMGLLFGHKYRPRMNSRVIKSGGVYPRPGVTMTNIASVSDMLERTRDVDHTDTYVCDVCARCGDITEPEFLMEPEDGQ